MAKVSAEFINQKSPYKVIQVDDLSVRFITTSGVKYLVGFTPDSFIFDEGGYDFFIINESETAIQDHLVFETIIAVIESLFADTNNSAMIYICSPYDNRQNARARMFEMWFSQAHAQDFYSLTTYDSIDNSTGTHYYYGLILKKDNPEHDNLIEIFLDFIKDY